MDKEDISLTPMATPILSGPGAMSLAIGLLTYGATPPAVVRDALNDLYRYELRRMRDRHRGGLIDKPAYLDLVIATRKRYWPLTLSLAAWEKICASP